MSQSKFSLLYDLITNTVHWSVPLTWLSFMQRFESPKQIFHSSGYEAQKQMLNLFI